MDGRVDNIWYEVVIPKGTRKESVLQVLKLFSEKAKDNRIVVNLSSKKFFFKFSKRILEEDLVSICPEEDFEKTCMNGRRPKIDYDSLKTKDFDALFTDLAAVKNYQRNKVKCNKKCDKSVQSKTRKDVKVRLSQNIVPSSCTHVTVANKSDIESEEKERQEPEIEKLSSEKTFEILKSSKVDQSDVTIIYEVSSTLDQEDIPSQNIPTQTHAIESRKKFSETSKNNNEQKQERNRQWSKLHTKYRMKRREAYWKRKKLRIRKVCKLGIKKQWKKRKKRQSGRFKRKLKAENPEKKTKWKKKAAKAKSWHWMLNDYLKQKNIAVDNTLLDRYDKYCKETSWLIRDLTALLHHERSWRVSLYVYPTRRKNKGNRRNQHGRASSSQAAESAQNQPPIQVSDASNRDLDLPPGQLVVTSSRSTFNAFANNLSSPTPSSTVSIDSERTLRTRLRRELPDSRFSRAQQRPKHPEYSDQPARQRSFTNWPATTGQDPARMAIYGFFYTGRLDLIRCFQCGIGLKDWAGADEPLFEHIKHSPDCSFLKDLLGQDLFIAYRDNLQASQSQQAGNTATSAAGSETTAARVRNPQFKEMPARLSSFDKWPTTAQQSPQRLADAGLFYTGMNDLCRCFTCDGGLQRWDADDDPWIEHARWFPQCQYVRQIKGQEYINMVQQAAAQARAEEEDPSVIIPAVAQGAGRTGPVQQGMEDLNLEDNSPLNTYAAHSVIGIGFSRRAVLIAIDEYKRQAAPGKENDYGSTDLVRILRDREARGEALPPDSPMDTYLGATAAVLLPENLDPEEENRRLRDIMKCMVCRENDTNILFLPCTHHRMCEECAEKVQVCPVCDQKISEKIKTYLS